MEEGTDKTINSNFINLEEKTLTAIQLLKDVRKEIAECRKKEGMADEPSASNTAEKNAYKAVEEVLPRMIITPMLSAQIDRHKDKVAFTLKETELTKQIKELKKENVDLKSELAKSNAENEKVKAELANVEHIIRGLDLDKVPDGIPLHVVKLVEPRARKIGELKGVIKEMNKKNEALSKEVDELKNLLRQAEKPNNSNILQGKELTDLEALLDQDDGLTSPTAGDSMHFSPSSRKRLLEPEDEDDDYVVTSPTPGDFSRYLPPSGKRKLQQRYDEHMVAYVNVLGKEQAKADENQESIKTAEIEKEAAADT